MLPKRSLSSRARLILLLIFLSAMPCGIWGCTFLRPPKEVVEVRFVVIHPGKPYQILAIDGDWATVRTLDEPQEVSKIKLEKLVGNISMDADHWRPVKKVLDWYAKYKAGMITEAPKDASEK